METNKIISLWSRVKNLGLNHSPKEATSLFLLNQMGIIGGIGCLTAAFISLTLDYPLTYFIFAILYGVTAAMMPLFNHIGLINVSKLITSFFHPFIISGFIIFSGGSFGEESILIGSIFMIHLLYNEKPKMKIMLYISNASFYILAQVYIFNFPPILKYVDNPFDNFLAFVICSTWLLMIIYKNQQGIDLQKAKGDELISELQAKNESLKKTTEELEQFTYIASHDLKSPLRTIISFLDLIKRDVSRGRYDDLNSKLDFARGGAEQMNFLVTDILEYSRMTNGKKRKKKVIDLQTIADKVRFNLTDVIDKKNVDLYIFPLPKFYGNETELTVIFQNFIENGIKYNEENTPTIFVKSRIEEDHLILQFIDNGIGIEEQYFDKIFLFFKRLHTNNHYKGTGLGLGLCKRIIDDMEGTVKVESTINVGSTFTISLPIDPEYLVEKSKVLSEEFT